MSLERIELIRSPIYIGEGKGFSIPKRELELNMNKRYRLFIEEVK